MSVPIERIIELSELRIGNYLEYKGEIVHVTMLSLDIDDEYQDIIGFCKLGSFSNEHSDWNRALAATLNRIPITPDWLVKLGFEKYNDITYTIPIKEFGLQKLVLTGDGKDLIVSLADYYSTKESIMIFPERIQYLHQLQNIIFALTFKELKLTP